MARGSEGRGRSGLQVFDTGLIYIDRDGTRRRVAVASGPAITADTNYVMYAFGNTGEDRQKWSCEVQQARMCLHEGTLSGPNPIYDMSVLVLRCYVTGGLDLWEEVKGGLATAGAASGILTGLIPEENLVREPGCTYSHLAVYDTTTVRLYWSSFVQTMKEVLDKRDMSATLRGPKGEVYREPGRGWVRAADGPIPTTIAREVGIYTY